MKKNTWWVIGAIVAVIAFYKYRMANSLTYSFNGISLGLNGLTPVLIVSINITNPTSTTTTIDAINVTIISNGITIGNVNATYNQSIAANTTTVLQLPVNISISGLINDITTTIQQAGATFEINGSITADGIALPTDIKYNF
jgi:LEA14-like dessication related protein